MKDIAILGCRLFAIYWLVIGIRSLAFAVAAIPAIFDATAQSNTYSNPLYVISVNVVPFTINILIAILLWVKAEKISDLLVSKNVPTQRAREVNYHATQTLIFSGIGAFILLSVLPEVGGKIYLNYLIDKEFSVPRKVDLEERAKNLQLGLEILLGFGLLFGSRAISNLLLWLREFGLKARD